MMTLVQGKPLRSIIESTPLEALNNTLSAYGGSDTDLESEALPTEPTPKPRRAKGMTHKKLYQQIRLGYGQGHGSSYEPWLRLRRKNPSPKSNQVLTWLPPLNRVAHFFSRGEYHTALLLLWLYVLDLREQYPLWPLRHPHPLTGAPGTEHLQLAYARGLLEIAQEAGIDHGHEIGSRQPYVATMDIVVTVPGEGAPKLAAFSSKPFDDADTEVKWRTLERLELERRYAIAIDAPYHVSGSALVPLGVAGNLEWWLDCASLPFMPALILLAEPFADAVTKRPDLSIAEAVTYAAEQVKVDLDIAWLLFRHCGWTQQIDIDPSQRIFTSYPVRLGGRALRASLQHNLFGRAWS
jgi:hypothetical protein